MKVIKLSSNTHLRQSSLGGKAFNLQKLLRWGMAVPETYVITPSETRASQRQDNIKLELPPRFNKQKVYAVRSSGVGEDGNQNSFAGIFDTVLNVDFTHLITAVQQVYDSRNTAVTSMYSDAREARVIDMAVVIQEMIQPDYAGVAFSVSPVENDSRIGLIELVAGLGEALVSGKTKPTSVRLNRLTGMSRVIQPGEDAISEVDLDKLIHQVGNAVWKIESHYKKPVDIEWAYSKGKLYLLQARPITTLEEEV